MSPVRNGILRSQYEQAVCEIIRNHHVTCSAFKPQGLQNVIDDASRAAGQ